MRRLLVNTNRLYMVYNDPIHEHCVSNTMDQYRRLYMSLLRNTNRLYVKSIEHCVWNTMDQYKGVVHMVYKGMA
jgi:hypothetical protein